MGEGCWYWTYVWEVNDENLKFSGRSEKCRGTVEEAFVRTYVHRQTNRPQTLAICSSRIYFAVTEATLNRIWQWSGSAVKWADVNILNEFWLWSKNKSLPIEDARLLKKTQQKWVLEETECVWNPLTAKGKNWAERNYSLPGEVAPTTLGDWEVYLILSVAAVSYFVALCEIQARVFRPLSLPRVVLYLPLRR